MGGDLAKISSYGIVRWLSGEARELLVATSKIEEGWTTKSLFRRVKYGGEGAITSQDMYEAKPN